MRRTTALASVLALAAGLAHHDDHGNLAASTRIDPDQRDVFLRLATEWQRDGVGDEL